MLFSSFVTKPDVYARPSKDGRHILVEIDRARNVTLTMLPAEAASLRDAIDQALRSIPEGQR